VTLHIVVCLQGVVAFDSSRELETLPEPAPAAGASIHAWRLIEVTVEGAHSPPGDTDAVSPSAPCAVAIWAPNCVHRTHIRITHITHTRASHKNA
jgi:hypothetical protein